RRRVQVHVVDAHAGPADDLQARAGSDEVRVDRDLAPHDQGVVLADDPAQVLGGQAGPDIDLVAGAKGRDALGRDRLRDQDPHGWHRWAGQAGWSAASAAARSAAATAAPGW